MDNEKVSDKVTFGFWLYLMTDLVMFGALFAAFTVLRNNTFGGPSGHELFNLPYAFTETLILLTSSFSCGLAMLSVWKQNKNQAVIWFYFTFLLGATFLGLELREFAHLVSDGNSWSRSGFLSSFFTLVGTHGLHITVGLFWILVMMVQVARQGLDEGNVRKLTLLSLFWHFLDIVWIFIFSIVYLMS